MMGHQHAGNLVGVEGCVQVRFGTVPRYAEVKTREFAAAADAPRRKRVSLDLHGSLYAF